MNNGLPLVVEANLSVAWAKAFVYAIDNPGTEFSPFVASVTSFPGGEALEDTELRKLLDDSLKRLGMQSVHTVANTIFPESVWRYSRHDRPTFYANFKEIAPRIKAMEPAKNRRGLYFERMIDYGSGPVDGNQIEWLISQHRSGVRKSMFQVSIFDPARDHVPDAQLPFPCLQHLSFIPSEGKLYVNGFYATQQLFEKAYGNLLGLCRLGSFMAGEMQLELAAVNCVVGLEKLQRVKKTDTYIQPLLARARFLIAQK